MTVETIIGMTAAIICALSMFPQVWKVHLTKKTHDLSLGAFSSLASGLVLWIIYGIIIGRMPIIAGNAVGLAFCLYIIFMKIRHG